MEYDLVAIGRRITDLRKLHGMTQDALGEHLGMTGKQISCVEHGISSLTPKDFLEVSKLFSVSLDYLFTGNLKRELNDCVTEFVENVSYENQKAVWHFLRSLIETKGL